MKLGLFQPDRRILLDEVQVYLVADKLADIVHAVLDHRRALYRETESEDTKVLG